MRKISQLKGLSVLHGAGKNTSLLPLSFTESGSVVFLCEEYLHWEKSGNGFETHGEDLGRICEWVLPSQAIRKGADTLPLPPNLSPRYPVFASVISVISNNKVSVLTVFCQTEEKCAPTGLE